MSSYTAQVMLRFIDRIRFAAAHDPACEPDRNPLQRAYEVCISKLSDAGWFSSSTSCRNSLRSKNLSFARPPSKSRAGAPTYPP